MLKQFLLALVIICGTLLAAQAQHQQLRNKIDEIARASSGKVGVAVNLLENNDTLTYHNPHHYVMQSVFKLAVAMAVLHEVDERHLQLGQQIFITKADLPETYSPLRDKYPQGNVKVPVRELLNYMVTVSDNDACDILIKLLGGPDKVNQYVHCIGVKNIHIEVNEAGMAASWPAQYKNWCEPTAQIALLKLLYHQSVLSKTSNGLLWEMMLNMYVAPKRIRGLLPAGTPVAHRTGTSGTNAEGLAPGTNDVGVIALPNGKHLAIAILLTDSHDPAEVRDQVIATIAKAAYDEFAGPAQ